jgi:hypothetical protein
LEGHRLVLPSGEAYREGVDPIISGISAYVINVCDTSGPVEGYDPSIVLSYFVLDTLSV